MVQETSSGEEMSLLLLATYSIVAVLVVPAQLLFNSANRWSKDKLEMLHLTQLQTDGHRVGSCVVRSGSAAYSRCSDHSVYRLDLFDAGNADSIGFIGYGVCIYDGATAILFTLNVLAFGRVQFCQYRESDLV